MNHQTEVFDQLVKSRRSVRIFDQTKHFDHEAVTRSLQRALLAPNSSNMQLWEFYRIQSNDAKKSMAPICLKQQAAKTAQEIVVFVCPRNKWRSRLLFNLENFIVNKQQMNAQEKKVYHYYNKLLPSIYRNDPFGFLGLLRKIFVSVMGLKKPIYREVLLSDIRIMAHKSCALAAQTFMLSIAAEGYASCPMEGFDSKRLRKMLKLPPQTEINMAIAVGAPHEKGIYGPRKRIVLDQICHVL